MNPYNAVQYVTNPKPQTHPAHLGALAVLFGMRPAAPDRCRVLEMGCGTGGNLIAMALLSPESEYVGVDLASDPIAEGTRTIASLGLRNVELRAMDLMEFSQAFGSFDYIIAFGLFSWIPDAVRRKVLEICAAQLAPQGVAYINYNAYPGFHLRAIARDLLRFHVDGIGPPEEAIAQALGLADTVLQTGLREGKYGACLQQELEDIRKRPPGGLFHDDLSPENRPFYFHEFAAMARAHGLQYLAEAEYFTMHESFYGERVAEALKPFAGDPVRKEQYLDFLRGRKFRQTLLCHAAVALEREASAARIRELWFSCPARPDEEGRFRRAFGVPIKPVHPLARAALLAMADAWPQRLSFGELLTACQAESEHEVLAEILLGCYTVGLVEAHTHAPRMAIEPGAQPVASPLARMQLADDLVAVNLHHKLVQVGEEERRLVQLLDGTRGRAELERELGVGTEELELRLRGIGRIGLLME